MKKKYSGKRFVVFGSHPLSGGWGEYCVEHDTLKEARLEAWYWLSDSYDANILDQETDKVVEVRIKS
jgi:hypothetical protein